MRVVTMSEFSAIPGGKLAAIDGVLQITVNRIVIGYFVPPSIWLAKAGIDQEVVILREVLYALEDEDVGISAEQLQLWRERARLGEG